jgi:glycosyltransferase involved in cell wall biosynthesis
VTTEVRIGPFEFADPPAAQGAGRVSFVVPSFQAERTLAASIESIRASAPPSHEVIVVDDGSLDGTLEIARELADVVITRPCQGGAARCRNDGARVARGDILVFVDSDAVAGLLRHFKEGADAAFGAYEPLPPPEVRNVATTYKNLLHHYTHLHGDRDASTFWSGFGAVRREAFLAVHGFDTAATTGADVEDIHLGYRLRAAGYRIVLDPNLQVQHHKRYTVRGVIASDVFHRAVPWTRAMLQMRTYRKDLNLRSGALLGGLVSVAIPATAIASIWVGPLLLLLAGALVVLWFMLHRRVLSYFARAWSVRGAAASAGMLYLYYWYGFAGSAMGAAAYVLRRERRSALNWLHFEPGDAAVPACTVTLAVTVPHPELISAFDALPPLAPWWELFVIACTELDHLPEGAQFILAPPGATRSVMRQLALERAKGEMFATLDECCIPDPDWLERVRAVAATSTLVLAGAFRHDRRSIRQRADQVVRYWQFRPEQPPCWVVNHPATNAAFRTEVARKLGGLKTDGALILRLAGFGARPVRFDPDMQVQLAGTTRIWNFLHGVAGTARLRAAASARYFDVGALHRMLRVAVSPFSAMRQLFGTVRAAVREHSADRTFWLALPLISLGIAATWFGRDVGLLRPQSIGGIVPRSAEDLALLANEFPP